MNFYTLASKMEKSIMQETNNELKLYMENNNLKCEDDIPKDEKDKIKIRVEEKHITQFKMTCKLGIKLMNTFRELASTPSEKYYFITIRPDETKINFLQFYKNIYNLIQRKCFISYKLSFEQKGTDNESMGKGFHVHIIANMKQQSPGNVLRDIYSSVKEYTAFNCIDVKTLYTQQDIDNVEQYITEYKSDDDHKIITKECDIIWREKNNIANIYINNLDKPNNNDKISILSITKPTIKSS